MRCKPPVPIKGGNFGAKLTHRCGFWLTYHFSHTWKNIVRDSYWSYHFFSSVNTIVRSSDWLEPICVWKFAIWLLVSISQYVYNKCQFALKVLNFNGIIRHNWCVVVVFCLFAIAGESCSKFYVPDNNTTLTLGICDGGSCKCDSGKLEQTNDPRFPFKSLFRLLLKLPLFAFKYWSCHC